MLRLDFALEIFFNFMFTPELRRLVELTCSGKVVFICATEKLEPFLNL
jgi:hypothetical protein